MRCVKTRMRMGVFWRGNFMEKYLSTVRTSHFISKSSHDTPLVLSFI